MAYYENAINEYLFLLSEGSNRSIEAKSKAMLINNKATKLASTKKISNQIHTDYVFSGY